MSLFGSLLSLEGLVTVSLASLITIRTLRINWVGVQTSINVEGNDNIVAIYNQTLESAQGSYRYLWSVLAVALLAVYPFFGSALNAALQAIGILTFPLSLIGLVTACRALGARGLFNLFYVGAAFVIAWLIHHAGYALPSVAAKVMQIGSQAEALIPAITAPPVHGEMPLARLAAQLSRLQFLVSAVGGLLGIVALFLSACFVAFAFVKARNFDQALLYTLPYIAFAVLGFVLITDIPVAFQNGDLAYIKSVLHYVLPW